ncbi:MAG: hypothetical protein R3B48_19985 [Kofleriaceae bacterium]
MIKLFIGILKGSLLGGVIGYGAYALGQDHAAFYWITYALVGALVGLLVGRPIWAVIADKNATSFASILKALFGVGLGVGVYALVRRFAGDLQIEMLGETRQLAHWQPILGAAIGGLWGGVIELDDAFEDSPKDPKQLPKSAG